MVPWCFNVTHTRSADLDSFDLFFNTPEPVAPASSARRGEVRTWAKSIGTTRPLQASNGDKGGPAAASLKHDIGMSTFCGCFQNLSRGHRELV